MTKKTINIPEICRVEGHSAVNVEIENGKVSKVELDVFEGTRMFERIVIGKHFDQMPHITSRVCAICSTGHVLAAINAVERTANFTPSHNVLLLRELMHLGMIIESHATHVCALALPDFLNVQDIMEFATLRPDEFGIWTKLRNLGSSMQTVLGGRPFHPVNLQVGGLSKFPAPEELEPMLAGLEAGAPLAMKLAEAVLALKPPVSRTTIPCFLALIPEGKTYSFFGTRVRSSDGWEDSIDNYREYLNEVVVPYSHAKRSQAKGKPIMVGSMARLHFFSYLLGNKAKSLYADSPMSRGDTNTILNNLAQCIEIVEAIDRSIQIIKELLDKKPKTEPLGVAHDGVKGGARAGAVECPRGTLYHYYEFDEKGNVKRADMITPSAQNTQRIELDIKEVVDQQSNPESPQLQAHLETLVRAYDPCNTCATHMVSVKYK